MCVYRKFRVGVEVEGVILSILKPQCATGSVSVRMGDVFFVSVQSKRLNTSGSSQTKTLQDKATSEQQFSSCIVC